MFGRFFIILQLCVVIAFLAEISGSLRGGSSPIANRAAGILR